MTFIKELNEKYKNINFDFQISPRIIAFLDAMLYIHENNIQTTLYGKPTDQQPFLHAKSEHPRSLKSSILYSQALRLKTICSTATEFDKNCAIIKQKFLDQQYKEEVLTYNRTLPDTYKIVNKNWNILQINTEFHGVIQATSMIAFKGRKNLHEIIAGHTVKQGKVFKKNLARLNGKSIPCSIDETIAMLCQNIKYTNVYESTNKKNV